MSQAAEKTVSFVCRGCGELKDLIVSFERKAAICPDRKCRHIHRFQYYKFPGVNAPAREESRISVIGKTRGRPPGPLKEKIESVPTMCLHCHIVVVMTHDRGANPVTGAWACPKCGHLYQFSHWKIKRARTSSADRSQED